MKKSTWIALGLFAALSVVFLLVRDQPVSKVATPWSLRPVAELSRIEISRLEVKPAPMPEEEGQPAPPAPEPTGRETLVLEKIGGIWRITQPVNAPLSEAALAQIEAAFGKELRADDLKLDPKRAEEFELGDEKVARIRLFGQDKDKPAAELRVGRDVSISQTGTRRVYVQPEGKAQIYRVRGEVADLARQTLDALRSRQILKLEREKITALRFAHASGLNLRLEGDGNAFQLLEPQTSLGVDPGEVSSIVNNLTYLTASEFADGRPLPAVGLEPPVVTITVTAEGKDHVLHVGRVDSATGAQFFVRLDNQPDIFGVPVMVGERLVADLNSLRNRQVLSLNPEDITSVRFGGGEGVALSRASKDAAWTLDSPKDASFSAARAEELVQGVANLRAVRFVSLDPAEAGLADPQAETVAIAHAGQTTRIVLGKVREGGTDRYARLDGGEGVFLVADYNAKRLAPSLAELQDAMATP